MQKQNVVQQIKEQRRAEMVRDVLSFMGNVLTIGAVLFVLWAMLWAGCALSDVCYAANI